MKTKFFLTALIAIWAASPALAYVGPGVGLGAIGTVVAAVGAILLLIVGFIWYPIKRVLKRFKRPVRASVGATAELE